MAAPKKPHWFRLDDLLMPGSIPIIMLIATICIFAAGDNIQSATEGMELPTGVFGVHGLMVVVTLVSLGIYLRVLFARKSGLAEFKYVKGPNFAFMVHPGDYKSALDEQEVIRLAEQAFQDWSKLFSSKEIENFVDDALFWVWFKPHPLKQVRGQPVKAAGATIPGTRKMVVSFKDPNQELDATSFRHELGHVIQGGLTGSWNEAEHHSRSKGLGIR